MMQSKDDLSLDLDDDDDHQVKSGESGPRKDTSSSNLGGNIMFAAEPPKHSERRNDSELLSCDEDEVKIPLHKMKTEKIFDEIIRSSEKSSEEKGTFTGRAL